MRLTKPQRGVAIGMGVAAAATAISLASAFALSARHPAAPDARLALLGLSLLGPALALAVCIGRLASHRFATPVDIDGSGLTQGTARAKVLQALLQNTLEQAVLATLVYLACIALGSQRMLAMMGVGSILFVIGRALFFAGYSRGAAGRALGFGLTFYPTLLLLLCAAVSAAARLAD